MVIDQTKTAEYRMQMEKVIEANRGWFDRLGYDDDDFDLKAWMIWHRCGHDSEMEECSWGQVV